MRTTFFNSAGVFRAANSALCPFSLIDVRAFMGGGGGAPPGGGGGGMLPPSSTNSTLSPSSPPAVRDSFKFDIFQRRKSYDWLKWVGGGGGKKVSPVEWGLWSALLFLAVSLPIVSPWPAISPRRIPSSLLRYRVASSSRRSPFRFSRSVSSFLPLRHRYFVVWPSMQKYLIRVSCLPL